MMRNMKKYVGDLIKSRRELLGLKQPDLEEISGVSTRTIQLVENGKANPSLDTLLKIASPLGLTMQLLLKETGFE